jgi:hypothetical protein
MHHHLYKVETVERSDVKYGGENVMTLKNILKSV